MVPRAPNTGVAAAGGEVFALGLLSIVLGVPLSAASMVLVSDNALRMVRDGAPLLFDGDFWTAVAFWVLPAILLLTSLRACVRVVRAGGPWTVYGTAARAVPLLMVAGAVVGLVIVQLGRRQEVQRARSLAGIACFQGRSDDDEAMDRCTDEALTCLLRLPLHQRPGGDDRPALARAVAPCITSPTTGEPTR